MREGSSDYRFSFSLAEGALIPDHHPGTKTNNREPLTSSCLPSRTRRPGLRARTTDLPPVSDEAYPHIRSNLKPPLFPFPICSGSRPTLDASLRHR